MHKNQLVQLSAEQAPRLTRLAAYVAMSPPDLHMAAKTHIDPTKRPRVVHPQCPTNIEEFVAIRLDAVARGWTTSHWASIIPTPKNTEDPVAAHFLNRKLSLPERALVTGSAE